MDSRRLEIARAYGLAILPAYEVNQFKPSAEAILVRIKYPQDRFPQLLHPEHYADVLELSFDNIDTFDFDDEDFDVDFIFSKRHALQVLDFFERNRSTPVLTVHCALGISRSSAIGCAWAYFKENRDMEFAVRSCSCFAPNAMVYSRLVAAIEERKRNSLRLRV